MAGHMIYHILKIYDPICVFLCLIETYFKVIRKLTEHEAQKCVRQSVRFVMSHDMKVNSFLIIYRPTLSHRGCRAARIDQSKVFSLARGKFLLTKCTAHLAAG